MLISFNVLMNLAAVDLHSSLNSSSGHAKTDIRNTKSSDISVKSTIDNNLGLQALKIS